MTPRQYATVALLVIALGLATAFTWEAVHGIRDAKPRYSDDYSVDACDNPQGYATHVDR